MAMTKDERLARRRERERRQRQTKRIREKIERERNPAPKQTHAERVRTNRYLDAIADQLTVWIERTREDSPKWSPTWPIDWKSEQRYRDVLHTAGYPEPDDNGFLPAIGDKPYHKGRILSSNKIEFFATFATPSHAEVFRIVERVPSPLPCDQWGRLPLTLRQWGRIAIPLIVSECLWRFVHMVREYTENPFFQYYSMDGWYLGKVRRLRTDRNSELWTNRVILCDLLENYSNKKTAGEAQ